MLWSPKLAVANATIIISVNCGNHLPYFFIRHLNNSNINRSKIISYFLNILQQGTNSKTKLLILVFQFHLQKGNSSLWFLSIFWKGNVKAVSEWAFWGLGQIVLACIQPNIQIAFWCICPNCKIYSSKMQTLFVLSEKNPFVIMGLSRVGPNW